jgi:hypothetical protein
LPVAVAPLWQLAHEPGETLEWLNEAGFQAAVRWQESQDAVVAIWVAGLPATMVPLWQVEQVPG